MNDGDECWSRDEESFSYETLGDLLDSHDDLAPGDTVYVGDAVHPDPADFVDADDVIETMATRAYDVGGEYAEDYPDVPKEAKAELDELLSSWARKHCAVTFYSVRNVREYTLTSEDVPPVVTQPDNGVA